MVEFSWVLLLGGLSFFFFGLNYSRQGLQLLAGDRLRLGIARLTNNRLLALCFGAGVTVVLQSSTATILMLMSLASTGLLTLTQAFGVILGADIGTTLVVILLSIKTIADYSLLLVIFGFALEWIFQNSKPARYAGRILFGFGMVFFGMKLMTQTVAPLALNPDAKILFAMITGHPLALLLVSIVLTIIVQTSAATIGMAIALGLGGVLSLEMAVPIVLGANVGTCFTAIVASWTSNANGKRVALAHLLVKAAGCVLAMPFILEIVGFIEAIDRQLMVWFPMIQPGVAGQIAIFHLWFNGALAFLFLPFLPFGIWLISKFVPETKPKEAFGPKYLDAKALETPSLAFAQAKQELLRIANLTRDLYRDSLRLFEKSFDFDRLLTQVEEKDDEIDLLEREVRFYLAKIAKESLTDSLAAQEMALLSVGQDLEGVGDIISKELGRLAQKKHKGSRVFSEEGWQDIQKLHLAGLENFGLAIAVFTAPSEELTSKVKHQGERLNELEEALRESHIQRLHAQRPEAFETSSIHLDVLGSFRRINAHLVHMADVSLRT